MSSLPTRTEILAGWSQSPKLKCITYRPERRRNVQALAQAEGEAMIARGCGRSYGDASLCATGVIKMERLNRLLAFDSITGILEVEAGVTLAEIMDFSIPKGWLPPVIPGTKYVTLGGAFASNIHGKNHLKQGDIARHVVSLTLRLASGDTMICSTKRHKDIFWATAGGMGLTGVIESLKLQLMPITSLSLRTTTKRTYSVAEMVAAFRAAQNEDYTIGWIDYLTSKNKRGRGVFEQASHISTQDGGVDCATYQPPKMGMIVPPIFPNFTLNRYSMALYNKRRFGRYHDEMYEEIAEFEGFFHPLDSLLHWYRFYGRKGFFEYQCVLPDSEEIATQVENLLSIVDEHHCSAYLAVMKYHGEHQGLLSFPIKGFSLALDFPNTPKVKALVQVLNNRVAAWGGRVYLTKDALLSQKDFEQMYADHLPIWKKIVAEIDPKAHFNSALAMRLGMKDWA